MQTTSDCIPCFLRQARDAARLCGSPPVVQDELIRELSHRLAGCDRRSTPAELSRMVYDLVAAHTGCPDPYARIKAESIEKALALYPDLVARVETAEDPLQTALRLAIFGNLIDYGVLRGDEIKTRLQALLDDDGKNSKSLRSAFFAYTAFRQALDGADRLLYLGDNAGETVFDRVFLETIKKHRPKKQLTFAVRGKAIINDALDADARASGIDKTAEIVSSGSPAAGTVLSLCTEDFRARFQSADLIISKGQGNFEALSAEKMPIYFLLVAKCAMIARHVGCRQDTVLLLPPGWQAKCGSLPRKNSGTGGDQSRSAARAAGQ